MPASRLKWWLLVLCLAAPVVVGNAPGVAAIGAAPVILFDPASQTLALDLPQGASPAVFELALPPRLVVDFVGVSGFAPSHFVYPVGGVEQFDFIIAQGRPQAVLTLRQPLNGAWRIEYVGNRLLIHLNPGTRLPASALASPPRRPVSTPVPLRTPRPNPTFFDPAVRITPTPVYLGQPGPLASVSPPPIAVATPVPIAEPSEIPEPESPDTGAPPPIFGSRIYAGAEVPLSLVESYPDGNSDLTIGAIPGAVFGWDHMLTPNLGLALSGRAMSYTIQDDVAREGGVQLQHKRDDYEAALGLRGRFPLGSALEFMIQPGILFRTVQVGSTVVALVDDQADGTPRDAAVGQYLSSGWQGFGAGLGLGLGLQVIGPLSLAGTGEVNSLFSGNMYQGSVAPIFPLLGYRAGLEARLTFGWFGGGVGYHFTGYSNTAIGLNQTWSGPVVKLNVVY